MILIWLMGILVLLIVITVLVNILKNWSTMMNYKNLYTSLIIGTVLISILFSFTSVDILLKVSSYIIVIIISLFYGAFKKRK